MVKAKAAIILIIETGPLARLVQLIDDDDMTATELWDPPAKFPATSNVQLLIHLQHEFQTILTKMAGIGKSTSKRSTT